MRIKARVQVPRPGFRVACHAAEAARKQLILAACSCSARPRGISLGPDGCAASTTCSVSASGKRRPRSSPLSTLPRPLGIPVRTGSAPGVGPVAPSSVKTWRYSCGATSISSVSSIESRLAGIVLILERDSAVPSLRVPTVPLKLGAGSHAPPFFLESFLWLSC
jgi:hypothetical protein